MARPRAEIGATGLPLFAGRLSLDPNPRLRWPAAGRIYRDMDNNEPAVGALRQAVHTLLRSDVQVQPGAPLRAGRGRPKAEQRAADHVQACLGDLELGTALRQLASASFYGFDVHEIVYARRADGTVGWKRWGLRRQESFERWETKDGQVTAFVQRPAPDYVLRTIPLSKCLHLVADDSDASPEGRGVLRGMYRYWYMVTQFEILAGIALERFGTGMPVFSRTDGVPVVTLTPEQLNELATIAAQVRQNEAAYVLEPSGIKFRFEPSPGLNAQTYLDFIRAYRIWMLSVGMAEFIALGTSDTGSYALGSSKIALFLQALTGLQNKITDAINRQAIPRLMRANGWQASPVVQLPAVREYDLGALGNFAQTLANIGAFHATPEDEAWFRKISDLADVEMDEIERMHAEAKRQAQAIAGEEPQDEPNTGADDEDTAAPDDVVVEDEE